MTNQEVDRIEGLEETEVPGYESNHTMHDNSDETEETSIVNEQGEDVVNDQGYNHKDGSATTETEPVAAPEPGDDSPPPEIKIDPETPVTEQPTMGL